MSETWLPAPIEFAGYEISSEGRFRNSLTGRVRRGVDNGKGYLTIHVGDKFYKIHRLVATAFVPNPFGFNCVNHIDAIKSNNFASNLEWCTHAQNMKHAYSNGLVPALQGSSNGASKLVEDQVREIRKLYAAGARQVDLASTFLVSQRMISMIVRREKWRHV